MKLSLITNAVPDTGGRTSAEKDGGTSAATSGARRALWQMMRQACTAAALTHGLFLLVFAQLGLPMLVWTNVGSIALFLTSRAMLVHRRHLAAILLITGEVVMHAALTSALLGWESGFHYYLLTLVGPLAVGMNGTALSKVLRLLAIGVTYGGLDAWTRQVPPVYVIEPVHLDVIRYFNIAGMLAIMAFVSLSYYRLVASAERALRKLASTDPLTGLHNRRRLLDIARASRTAGAAAQGQFLLLCDIDHFKQVNDLHGHEMGDLVLEQVAGAITAAVRGTDSVARWGGEEFVVLLPSADLATAIEIAERIRRAVGAVAVERAAPRTRVQVTVTVGVSRFDPADTIDAAIARADAALYRGKTEGRDRVVVDGEALVPAFS